MEKFVLYENNNLIAYCYLDNGDIEFEFKPDCDKSIVDMWKKLNKDN